MWPCDAACLDKDPVLGATFATLLLARLDFLVGRTLVALPALAARGGATGAARATTTARTRASRSVFGGLHVLHNTSHAPLQSRQTHLLITL